MSGGAPSPLARSRSSERGGSALVSRLGHTGALPLLLLLRERAKWELPARCRLPLPAPPTWLSFPNSHRTFHDMGIRERLRSLAPACYPPVVPVLRIEEHRRIREPVHEGVALVDVAVALAPLAVRGQEVESVDAGHRPRHSLLVPAHAESGCGRLTATTLGVEALGLDVTALDPRIDTGHAVTPLDPRIDTGHAVTPLDVNGRGLLTAIGHAVSIRVPLPAGEIGVTARGHPLSRIARVTARGSRNQDNGPDKKHRRVLRRLPPSLLRFLKRRRLSLLLQEGRL